MSWRTGRFFFTEAYFEQAAIMSHFAESRRKINVAREKFRHAASCERAEFFCAQFKRRLRDKRETTARIRVYSA